MKKKPSEQTKVPIRNGDMGKFKALRAQTRTPKPVPDDYDWRKEPWLKEDGVRALAYYIAHHVLTAMALDSEHEGGTDQDEEDERVFGLLSPELMEAVWKGPQVGDYIRFREVAAAAMGIDRLISAWMKRFGSIDHGGPPSRPLAN